jgi:pre-mRNA-splicing factor ATP-dependent RNA helicase DHX16
VLSNKLISELDFPNDGKTREFAAQLIARMDKPKAGPSTLTAAQAKAKAQADADRKKMALLRKNESFALIDELDDVPAASAAAASGAPAVKKQKMEGDRSKTTKAQDEDGRDGDKPRKHAKAIRTARSGADDDEPMPDAAEQKAAAEAKAKADAKAEEDEHDSKRAADQKEKKDFEQRLLDREKAKTKQKTATKEDIEAEKRKDMLALDEDELEAMIPQIRDESRFTYLSKREAQQLELMRRVVEDEERLFGNDTLTPAEKRRHTLRKRILELATERQKKAEVGPQYMLPDDVEAAEGKVADKREQLMKRRSFEERKEFDDDNKILADSVQRGAWTGRKGRDAEADKYNLLEDNAIEFIIAQAQENPALLFPDDVRAEKEADAAKAKEEVKKTEFEKIQESRKMLPIFPYRTELLAAVEKFQSTHSRHPLLSCTLSSPPELLHADRSPSLCTCAGCQF